MDDLTIRRAQQEQPWTVPYSQGVQNAHKHDVPHILATHVVLHAAKTIGKLAAVFEALDHPAPSPKPTDAQWQVIANMSADLLVVALRLANLYGFDLQDVLVARVREKNGTGYE